MLILFDRQVDLMSGKPTSCICICYCVTGIFNTKNTRQLTYNSLYIHNSNSVLNKIHSLARNIVQYFQQREQKKQLILHTVIQHKIIEACTSYSRVTKTPAHKHTRM